MGVSIRYNQELWQSYIVLGDSITYGAWDIQGSGWASRLRLYLDGVQEKDESKYFLTYNLGIPGENTDGLVGRFESEFKARSRNEDEESVFVFAYGANDSVFFKSTNEFCEFPKIDLFLICKKS